MQKKLNLLKFLVDQFISKNNYFDTAKFYFDGYSEELIWKALEGREDIIIALELTL